MTTGENSNLSDSAPDAAALPAQETKPQRQPLPDIADLLFVFLAFLMVNWLPGFVLNDGSIGWHVATGQYILQHGQIPHTDLFSNTFSTRPWVPYEWLADVLAAFLVQLGGIKMLGTAAACAVAWLIALLYLECRREGCHFILAMALCLLGAITSTIHWHARPHLFTFFGVYLFSRHLERYRRGEESAKRLMITLFITMVIWSNAHPAFLVGIAIVIIYMISELIIFIATAPEARGDTAQRLKIFALTLLAVIAATFINANAGQLYHYILVYLSQSYVLQHTNEYMPPNFKQLHAICMALIFFAFVVGLALTRRRPALAQFLMVMAFAWLAVNSMRNEPLFVIVAIPITGYVWSNVSLEPWFGAGYSAAPWLDGISRKLRAISANVNEVESLCTMHLLPIVTTVLLFVSCLFGGNLGPLELVRSEFDPKTHPTTTLACIKENKLDWRQGLNFDNWGGYIYYKTGERVFIDDRLDFYGTPFMADYGDIVQFAPGYEELLKKYKIDWVLFPKESTFLQHLLRTGQWRTLCEDKAALLLIRNR